MIPIETLRRVSAIYTHANCPDGLASAMILKDAFRMLGMAPRIEFLTHNTPEHRSATPYTRWGDAPAGVECSVALFCDFAPHPDAFHVDRYASWKDAVEHAGQHTIVLDHHKGAEDIVRAFGELGVFADEKLEPGVSGAVLAYREVWKPVEEQAPFVPYSNVKEFAECIGARDTWQTQDPRFMRGQWISKMLMSKPREYWLDTIARDEGPYLSDEEIAVGRALFEAHEESVRQATAQCCMFDIVEKRNPDAPGELFNTRSTRLAVFQEQASGFRLTSDVAEWFRKNVSSSKCPDVVAGFSYVVPKPGEPPRLVYSLRSVTGLVNVAAFAKTNGGGGHTAAAGFDVEINEQTCVNPYKHIYLALDNFLRHTP